MTLVQQIIEKHKEDRERVKALKAKHAEELRVIEEFQFKREMALIERAGVEAFEYMTDIYVNGRDGKAEVRKQEMNIGLQQEKIESWLLKILSQVGESIRTSSGTVYKTRKESVSVSDFDMFVDSNMLKDAAVQVIGLFEQETNFAATEAVKATLQDVVIKVIHENMHLEYLNKAVNKTSILELMGDQNKDGSRPNTPPAGISYVAIQTVGVRKATK